LYAVRAGGVSHCGGTILAGALVAKLTMEALDIRAADVCPWALREGIMLHYLQTTKGESWAMPLHHARPRRAPHRTAE
jgi:exopolyphosphatase/pppGpp-phosphohydrolase